MNMRAKLVVSSVENFGASERVNFRAVSGDAPYGPEGESDDNTYARYTPDGSCSLSITNPALIGKFKPGQKFYVDFARADVPAAVVEETALSEG